MSRSDHFLFLALTSLNILVQASFAPLWVVLISFGFMAWSGACLGGCLNRPSPSLVWFMSVLGCACIYFFEPQLFGPEALQSSLILLAGAKVLEAKEHRDGMFLVLVQYFLLLMTVLVHQGLNWLIFLFVDIFMITACLFRINQAQDLFSLRSLFLVLRLLAWTLPVWALFFIFFPRFATELGHWQKASMDRGLLPKDLDPGAWSQVVLSDEVVFRAVFKTTVPPETELYWRGTVLEDSHGLYWRRAKPRPYLKQNPKPDPRSFSHSDIREEIVYELQQQAQQGTWIFALDFPSIQGLDSKVEFKYGDILERKSESLGPEIYLLRSTRETHLQELSPLERRINLETPLPVPESLQSLIGSLNRESQKLAGAWTPERAKAKVLLQWFKSNQFSYSQKPGRMVTEKSGPYSELETFLFKNKKGFCEHFAASFATLARMMGIPARVVIGFQGGEPNVYGGFLKIRGLDAHAWVEIWDERWLRVDPTAFIVPDRIRLGGDFNRLSEAEIQSGLSLSDLRTRLYPGFEKNWRELSMLWDLLQTRSISWLNSWDEEKQKALWSRLGFAEMNPLKMKVGIFILIALMLGLISWLLKVSTVPKDPLLEAWIEFCDHMEKRSFPRSPQEPPLTYFSRLRIRWPHLEEDLKQVEKDYLQLRYGPHDGVRKFQIRNLRRRLKNLTLRMR